MRITSKNEFLLDLVGIGFFSALAIYAFESLQIEFLSWISTVVFVTTVIYILLPEGHIPYRRLKERKRRR